MDELGSDLNSLVQQAGRVRKAPEHFLDAEGIRRVREDCLLYTSPSPRDRQKSRMPSSA